MKILKYTILLANFLFFACDDAKLVTGNGGHPAAAQKRDGAHVESHWRGLVVRPESRCSPYERSDYHYAQSVELAIIEELGGIYSPYTGRCFAGRRDTDIEHIVALSEAHDSGLCEPAPNIAQIRRAFAADPLNLTLASPAVNRHRKQHRDAAEWMPPVNKCWFAQRNVAVRQKYRLTIDREEAEALERILASCASVEMEPADCTTVSPPLASSDALSQYDDNGNGRITCAEARRHGIAPVRQDHPAYPFMRDGNGDGVVCE